MPAKIHTTPQLKIELTEKQRWAFYSPATEILYGGAAAGGKSLYLRVSAIRWAEAIPKIQIYLFRRTFPDLQNNHLRGPKNFFELLAGSLATGTVKYSKKDNEFLWVKTGSRIRLCHCQYEDNVLNYQGAEIHVLLMDELTHFTEYQYRFLRSRVRAIGIDIPEAHKARMPRIEAGANPGGVGHKWVKAFFIQDENQKAEPLKIRKMTPKEGGMLRQYIPARLEDNQYAIHDDPEYSSKLEGMGSPLLVKAMREGDWDIFAGQYFSEFIAEHHVYDSFPIPKDWRRFRAMDWGYSDPFCCLWFAVGPDNQIWVYREFYRNRLTDSEYAEAICALSKNPDGTDEKIEYTVGDPGSFWVKNPDTGVERHETFALNGVPILKGDNNRLQGWSRVREYLKLRDYAGRKTPWVKVSSDCKNLIRTLPSLVHDSRNVEDVADGMEDHAADAFRYGLQSRAPHFTSQTKKYRDNFEAAEAQMKRLERRGIYL